MTRTDGIPARENHILLHFISLHVIMKNQIKFEFGRQTVALNIMTTAHWFRHGQGFCRQYTVTLAAQILQHSSSLPRRAAPTRQTTRDFDAGVLGIPSNLCRIFYTDTFECPLVKEAMPRPVCGSLKNKNAEAELQVSATLMNYTLITSCGFRILTYTMVGS